MLPCISSGLITIQPRSRDILMIGSVAFENQILDTYPDPPALLSQYPLSNVIQWLFQRCSDKMTNYNGVYVTNNDVF